MPVDDGCQTDFDALEAKRAEADEFCDLALEALAEWVEIGLEAVEDCADQLGDPPDLGDGDLDPMLQHELERQLEEYHGRLGECVANDSLAIDAWNLFLDLEAACDIARGEAEALEEAYEACKHAQHDGIPFA